MRMINHWIGGLSTAGVSGRTGLVADPAVGRHTGRVALGSAADVRAAVEAARDAFPDWRRSSLAARTRVLFAYRHLLHAHRDELAALITSEHGKAHSDALNEVTRGIEAVEHACAIPQLLKGSFSEGVSASVDACSVRQPLGVASGITPFNFPVMVPLRMFPMAIACGNTFVLKPSERAPSAALRIAELFTEAGLPDGVLNVVHGDAQAVEALLTDPDVRSVSFAGSTPVARHVHARATAAGKRVQALGGAKNHMLVMPDADMDLTADAAVSSAYGSAGQRCLAVSVLLAVGSSADDLVPRIAKRIASLRIGPGSDPTSDMGPLISRDHCDRVAAYVEAGAQAGASVVVDGRDLVIDGTGYFLGPSLLDHVTPDMSVYTDEIFGPVLAVVRVNDYDEALQLINDSPWGNGAVIFTQDGGAARRFQVEADAAMIGVNVSTPVPVSYYSFTGWKDSQFGDSGAEGVNFYTKGKVITTRWPSPADRALDLGFPCSQ
ncbi:CoA-acylating methylmalonate-semialdehyde dehydrogenase [Lentzea sp. DG1S-22]|uniref:CoA-acylating methylmalonate-semialdehyde dehydrogenase n=1 Tax=Lentzea sp. DG1S-22 TaxID=3108822 RepID=UPI002E769EDC|nr:CoA-acylating methylmalonate-semialdehyde dehydrogenase [Lentzea sp. DG1S-22]WVH82356.1 CoA-acylating methylmalonate-semialdehyde dehydrogenase [Lentzea sp. DG1S-22]